MFNGVNRPATCYMVLPCGRVFVHIMSIWKINNNYMSLLRMKNVSHSSLMSNDHLKLTENLKLSHYSNVSSFIE